MASHGDNIVLVKQPNSGGLLASPSYLAPEPVGKSLVDTMALDAGRRTYHAKSGQDRGRGVAIDCPHSRSLVRPSLGYHEAFPILTRTRQASPAPKLESLISPSLPPVTQRTQSHLMIFCLSHLVLLATPSLRDADLESGAA